MVRVFLLFFCFLLKIYTTFAKNDTKNAYLKGGVSLSFFNFKDIYYPIDGVKVAALEFYYKGLSKKYNYGVSFHSLKGNIMEIEVDNFRVFGVNEIVDDTTLNNIRKIRNLFVGIRSSYTFNVFPKEWSVVLTIGPSINTYLSCKKNYEYSGLFTTYQDVRESDVFFYKQIAIGADFETMMKLGYYLNSKWYLEMACPFKMFNIHYTSAEADSFKMDISKKHPSVKFINYLDKMFSSLNYQRQFYIHLSVSYKI